MDEAPRTIAIKDLEGFCAQAFMALGVPQGSARLMASILVEADLRGHSSHGTRLLAYYAPSLRSGEINPKPNLRMLRESSVSVLVDGDRGFGAIGASKALDRCLQKAASSGVGLAGVFNSNHLFIPGHYVLRAARQGYLAFCTTTAMPIMPPTGGLGRVLGNNPWAFGIPLEGRDPIVLDFAPAASFAKIRMYAAAGTPIPAGWARDKHGNPTTDPHAAIEGTLIPLGDHKGYGLALVAEVLAAVLTGSGYGPQSGMPGQVGHFLLLFDPNLLMAAPDFYQRMEDYITKLKSGQRQPGVEEIFYPGERAGRLEREARARGTFTLPKVIWQPLLNLAQELGLALTFLD